jgi:hypothetical protein
MARSDSYNKRYKKSHWFFDSKNKMILYQNPGWDPDGNNGIGDSIGRFCMGYFTWGNPALIEGIRSCWEKIETKRGYYSKGWRYPTKYEDTLSRDHLYWTVMALKFSEAPEDEIKDFVKHLKWKISERYSFTIDLWLFLRAISGIKWAKPIWMILETIIIFFTVIWHKFAYKMGGFDEEYPQKEFFKIQNHEKPDRKVKWLNRLYPVYALHQTAWQLRSFEKDNFLIRIMRKMLLSITGKTNWAIRILLGDKNIKKEDIFSYKSMKGWRWSAYLEPHVNDRDISINEDEVQTKYNKLDVDYLIKLWELSRLERAKFKAL